ncbi:hypothetical protein CES85_5088 [Ochrobactrum quorumnocens]|uniref:Uncharacterized protein n=1 Tax=Ochrobactrum quorumnocens TaxID=271865 RepID=A0A248UCA2_9HYPH|nr:hypothetical protein CES85_5088 [[Ochrobactrum] quorumnocens]
MEIVGVRQVICIALQNAFCNMEWNNHILAECFHFARTAEKRSQVRVDREILENPLFIPDYACSLRVVF